MKKRAEESTIVDAQEIPILTEVYASQKTKHTPQEGLTAEDVMAIVEDYKSELVSELKQTLLDSLKPQLAADMAEEVSQRVKQSLGEEVAAQLKSELVTSFRKEIAEELKATNHTVSALQNAFTNLPDLDQDELLQAVEQKNQTFLATAKQLLNDTQTRLIHESSERMSLEIAGKVAGMQELAVTQAKSQVTQQLQGLERGFRENVEALAQQLQQDATDGLKLQLDAASESVAQGVVERHKQTLSEQLVAFYEAQAEQSKQAHEAQLAAMAQAYQAQLAQSQESFNQQTQRISQELLQVVTAYAQTLNQESEAKLNEVKAQFEAMLTTQGQQLEAESTARLVALQQTVDTNLGEATQHLTAQLQQWNEQQLAKGEAMQKTLLAHVEGYSTTLQSDAEQLAMQAKTDLQSLHTDLLEQASTNIQSTIRDELSSLVDEKRAQFKQSLDADTPAISSLLEEKVQLLVTAALPTFEQALVQKARASVIASLANARLVVSDET